MIPGTYVPHFYDTRYVRYVCTWYQPAEIYTYVRYVPPVDAHVWRQLHLSAVARCSDSYCIFRPMVRLVCRFMLLRSTKQLTLSEECRVDRSMSHAAAVCCSCWPKNANYLIRAKRVSNCYIPKKKSVRVSCVRLILVLVGSVKRYCCRTLRQYDTRYVRTTLYDTRYVLCTRYVRTLCSTRGRTRLTTVTSISCRSL